MPVKPGQTVTVEFTTANPTTGAAADASSTPTGTLYVNGTANAASVTVTNQATGVYKASVTLPTLASGDLVAIRISATVATIAGEGIIWQDTVDTVHVSDVSAQVAAIDPLDATETQAAAAAAIAAASLPTASQIDTQLSGTHGAGSWTTDVSGGIYTQTVTVTSDGSTPIPNATVAIYSGSTLVDLKATNSSGVATPTCDAGTYTLRVTASGYASHSAALTVTGDATIATITLTAISVTAPTNPGTATGRLDLHAKDTMTAAYQSIYVRQTARRSTDGHGDSKEWREIVADASGVIEAAFWKSQTYEAKRGRDGTPVAFTVGTEDTFYLPSILGEP